MEDSAASLATIDRTTGPQQGITANDCISRKMANIPHGLVFLVYFLFVSFSRAFWKALAGQKGNCYLFFFSFFVPSIFSLLFLMILLELGGSNGHTLFILKKAQNGHLCRGNQMDNRKSLFHFYFIYFSSLHSLSISLPRLLWDTEAKDDDNGVLRGSRDWLKG